MRKEVNEMVQRNKEIASELKLYYRLKKQELDKDEKFAMRSREYKKLIKKRLNLERDMEMNPKAVVRNERILKLAMRVQARIEEMDEAYRLGFAASDENPLFED